MASLLDPSNTTDYDADTEITTRCTDCDHSSDRFTRCVLCKYMSCKECENPHMNRVCYKCYMKCIRKCSICKTSGTTNVQIDGIEFIHKCGACNQLVCQKHCEYTVAVTKSGLPCRTIACYTCIDKGVQDMKDRRFMKNVDFIDLVRYKLSTMNCNIM